MASGINRLVLAVALLALLAGALAASACGGGSKEKATPAATSPAGTPKATTQAATTPEAEGASVEIKNFAFEPKTVTIKVGQTVTWTNQDSVDPHRNRRRRHRQRRPLQGEELLQDV